MANWTVEQLEAIETDDCDLLISAGAGSGKTAVLVERLIRLITEEKVRCERLLVVTFTRPAAHEMKQRIRNALFEELRRIPEKERYFSSQIEGLENAQISTLHAFCLSIVSSYSYIIGLDPAAKLLSESEAVVLKNECMKAVFESYYLNGDENFTEVLDKYCRDGEEETLSGVIEDIYNYCINRSDPIGWLTESCVAYNTPLEGSEVVKKLMADTKPLLEYLERLCEEAFTILAYNPDAKRETFFNALMERVEDLSRCSDFRSFLRILSQKLKTYPSSHYEQNEVLKGICDRFKKIYNKLKADFAFSFESFESQLSMTAQDAEMLRQLSHEFYVKFAEAKRELNCVDYNDLEHHCLEILSNDDIASEVRNRFDFVMVDEYQDTNEIQEKIVSMVVRPGRLFCVGDLKQSIYGFRQADPEIFIARYEDYKFSEAAEGKLIILNTNFRCKPRVVDAINFIFDRIFFKQTSGVDYYPDERLVAARTEDTIVPQIRLVQVSKKEAAVKGEAVESTVEADEELSGIEQEAVMIAVLISEILSSERRVTDPKTGILRPIQPSDIALICRSLSSTHTAYEQALKDAHIPYRSDYGLSYYDEMEVVLVMNVLELIDNEFCDMAMVSVMRSFIYSFTSDELLEIRRFSEDEFYFYKAVNNYYINGGKLSLRLKISRLYDDISYFRRLNKYASLERLIKAIYSKTFLYAFVGSLPGGVSRHANLDYLSRLAYDFEMTSLKGLHHFLSYIDNRRRQDAESRRAVTSGDEPGVNLMTIHKSKGLEFEVVILAGITKKFNTMDTRKEVVCNRELGICSQFTDLEKLVYGETLLSKAAKHDITSANTSEEMRLLYVGMTRAKSELYLSGVLKKPFEIEFLPSPSEYEIMSATSYWDWVKLAIGCENFDEAGYGIRSEFWEVHVFEGLPEAGAVYVSPKQEDKVSIAREPGLVSRILNFRYPYEKALLLPSKLSVTTLKDISAESAMKPSLEAGPRFTQGLSGRFTAADRGTLTHLALQKLDYSAFNEVDITSQLLSQLAMMRSEGIFTEEELRAIDYHRITDFLLSDIGEKLRRASEIHLENAFLMSESAQSLDETWIGSTEEILIQGVIDCWFIYEGEVYLLDYKTDRYVDEERFDETMQGYTKQVSLYKKALERIRGKAVDYAFIYFLSMKFASPV
jgi:ATP-dependent helicase/nuclease subunit A